MAHQDYVSRSRSQSKKRNPYNQKQDTAPNNQALKFKIVTAITIVAIGVFAYGLWKIKDNNGTAPHVIKEASKQTDKTQLPEPPKEKWKYLEELKQKEVEEGQYAVESNKPRRLQCGTFKTRKQAEVLKANIAFAGLEANIKTAQGDTATWHKVILGPYPNKRAAEKDKHRLRSNDINHCKIYLWN